jgi:hypothetical protein
LYIEAGSATRRAEYQLELARAAGAAVSLSGPGLARVDVPLGPPAERIGESTLKSTLRALAKREVALVEDTGAEHELQR